MRVSAPARATPEKVRTRSGLSSTAWTLRTGRMMGSSGAGSSLQAATTATNDAENPTSACFDLDCMEVLNAF